MSLRSLRAAVETWAPGRGIAADPLHRIAAAWAGIVGAGVAAQSEPIGLNGGTLLVATGSSAWSQQLQSLSPAILAGVAALPEGVAVRRIAFRSGGLRRTDRRTGGRRRTATEGARAAGRRTGESPPPAADAREALERLRRRFAAGRPADSAAACAGCGAPLDDPAASDRCAPCAGAAQRERLIRVERTIYLAPWLTHAELREAIPDLSGSEFERARRVLLQRWWLVLERVRLRRSPPATAQERQVASSYVLLQSRLPPDRITPAVVRNLLGDDTTRAVWPEEAAREPGRTRPRGE